MRSLPVLCSFVILLAACGEVRDEIATPVAPGVPDAISPARLGDASYTLTDPGVRSSFAQTGQSFVIQLRSGIFRSPVSAGSVLYGRIEIGVKNIRYGDLNGDAVPDAVVPLLIGESENTVLELAAVSASGSTAHHFASFPLGRATLKSLAVTQGKIRVNFTHTVPGDPGPRNTELTLELPEGAYR